MNINDFNVGDKINVSTKTYQINYNKSLKLYRSKNKKKYTDLEFSNDIKKNKKTRPIVIIHNNKEQDFFLAVSESNSKSSSQIRNNYKNKKNNHIWKFELLVFTKEKIRLFPSKETEDEIDYIWERYANDEVNNFLLAFKNRKAKREIYNAILEQMQK